jgi:hypothetical protein
MSKKIVPQINSVVRAIARVEPKFLALHASYEVHQTHTVLVAAHAHALWRCA